MLPILGDRPVFFFDLQMPARRQFPVYAYGKTIASRLTPFVDSPVQVDKKLLPDQCPQRRKTRLYADFQRTGRIFFDEIGQIQ